MMSHSVLLSMTKAVGYLGDIESAQHLLVTLESTLASDVPKIEAAIHAPDFELLQTKWHQLKGFAPVFCSDALVEEIFRTEKLCQHTLPGPTQSVAPNEALNEAQNQALKASKELLKQLKQLHAEVLAQLANQDQL